MMKKMVLFVLVAVCGWAYEFEFEEGKWSVEQESESGLVVRAGGDLTLTAFSLGEGETLKIVDTEPVRLTIKREETVIGGHVECSGSVEIFSEGFLILNQAMRVQGEHVQVEGQRGLSFSCTAECEKVTLKSKGPLLFDGEVKGDADFCTDGGLAIDGNIRGEDGVVVLRAGQIQVMGESVIDVSGPEGGLITIDAQDLHVDEDVTLKAGERGKIQGLSDLQDN